MNKAIFIFIFLLLLSGLYYFVSFFADRQAILSPIQKENLDEIKSKSISSNNTTYIFVPYWTFNTASDESGEETYIYFGVEGGIDGINILNEPGFMRLPDFSGKFETQKKFLAIRMIDSDVNSKVVQSEKMQDDIIFDSVELVKKYGFTGIVLDFEMNAIPFQKVVDRITSFYEKFYVACRKEKMPFLVTIYGDVFYRVRPYDVEKISRNSDGVLVMAYDFHKSRGNPGPNFPLNGKERYGYDFKSMIGDLLKIVPIEKISIIFGMFGYDWIVDEKGESSGSGEALSLNKVKQDFLTNCNFSKCSVERDVASSETMVLYEDESGYKHQVWFEDMESVESKKKVAKENGINSFGYWAYSYY